jgi:hypothetical protein
MVLIAHNQIDRQFLKGLPAGELGAFTAWFTELNKANTNNEAFYANQPLEIAKGIECWFGFYLSGMTPQQALKEDQE